jgi:hypothetical protein
MWLLGGLDAGMQEKSDIKNLRWKRIEFYQFLPETDKVTIKSCKSCLILQSLIYSASDINE